MDVVNKSGYALAEKISVTNARKMCRSYGTSADVGGVLLHAALRLSSGTKLAEDAEMGGPLKPCWEYLPAGFRSDLPLPCTS
jgi:hypothetical protein